MSQNSEEKTKNIFTSREEYLQFMSQFSSENNNLVSVSTSALFLQEYQDYLQKTYELYNPNYDVSWTGYQLGNKVPFDQQQVNLQIILATLSQWDKKVQQLCRGLIQHFSQYDSDCKGIGTIIPLARFSEKQWDIVLHWPTGSHVCITLEDFLNERKFIWSEDPRCEGGILIAKSPEELTEALQRINDVKDNFGPNYLDDDAYWEKFWGTSVEDLNILTVYNEWKRNEFFTEGTNKDLLQVDIQMEFTDVGSIRIMTLRDLR